MTGSREKISAFAPDDEEPAPLPKGMRRRTEWYFRYATASLRALPDFYIIGTAKAGSTTLFKHLARHPQIERSFRKEVHYFDRNFERGENWYRAHFPFRAALDRGSSGRRRRITGEGTPYYVFHPCAAERIHALDARAKLILILRNPVERAYSHYQQNVNRDRETLSFEEAIEDEGKRIGGEVERLLSGELAYSFNHQHYSYVARGLYLKQIEDWLRFFPREQLLVLFTEELGSMPQRVMDETTGFLGIDKLAGIDSRRDHTGIYQETMPDSTRARLTEFYREPNEALAAFLGRKLPW